MESYIVRMHLISKWDALPDVFLASDAFDLFPSCDDSPRLRRTVSAQLRVLQRRGFVYPVGRRGVIEGVNGNGGCNMLRWKKTTARPAPAGSESEER